MTQTEWNCGPLDLQQVQRLAEVVALDLHSGDCICLHGDLGAGKTTFATALIQAYANDDTISVPSPTFTLLERYDLPRGTIHHADLYRLEHPDEADELGLDDALAEGALLVEWPERAPASIPGSYLTVALKTVDDSDSRDVRLIATPAWHARLTRLRLISDFLQSKTTPRARIRYLQGDASARRYARVHMGDGSVRILMDAPRQPDGPPIQNGLPYSAIAHLAEDIIPFVAVAKALSDAGIRVPNIHATDLDAGLLLLEDLGDDVFGNLITNGESLEDLYTAATNVLSALRMHDVPETISIPGGVAYTVPHFDEPAFAIETRLLPDWYIPFVTGANTSPEASHAFDDVWRTLFPLIDGQSNWVLRDFHSPNLIRIPDASGLAATGVIDFQDAMIGHAAYDLVSLLQDARLDVSQEIENKLLNQYCAAAASPSHTPFDETEFRRAYAILGAQRNTKILGIFARLARRDSKPGYLVHIPRIWGYLERNLAHPDLKSLKAWYDTHLPAPLRQVANMT